MLPPPPAIHLMVLALACLVNSDPNAPCYDPRGDRAPGYYPCDPTAYITNCCPQGWTCFSNSLCVVTTPSNAFPNLTLGEVVRSSCTNPLWTNDICGDYCLDDADADGAIASCGGNRFCCAHEFEEGTCNCSPGGGAFTVNPGRAQTILGVSDTSFTGSPTYASPTRLTTATTPAKTTSGGGANGTGSVRTTTPTTTPSLVTESSSLTATSRFTSPVPSSPTPTAIQNGSDGSDGSSSTGGTSKSLKIGLGVGIPLAALAIAGGALWYVLWYKRQKREADGGLPPVGGTATATAGAWGTSDDLAENERAESPVLSRPAGSPGMAQTRAERGFSGPEFPGLPGWARRDGRA